MNLQSTSLALVDDDWGRRPIEAIDDIERHIERPLDAIEKWLPIVALAELASIGNQRAAKVLKARKWRGVELQVREVEIGRGGASGMALQVHVDSLPSDLRERWYFEQGIDLHAKSSAEQQCLVDAEGHFVLSDPFMIKARERAAFIHRTIAPALKQPARSSGRGAAVKQLLDAELIFPCGRVMTPTKKTVHNWINAYEADGIHGLMRRKRSDVSAPRYGITRAWDTLFLAHLSEEEITQAAEQIDQHIRGLWTAGARGWRGGSESSTTRLLEISDAFNVQVFERLPLGRFGDPGAAKTKFGVCNINRRRVEKHRSYHQIAIKDKDNKLYEDKFAPSIRRDYRGLNPRDIVVGDVHPVDIKMLRDDGSEVYPKAIAWFDPATNEIHMTFALLEKDEGIRREHVAQSFGAMVEEWGLPRLLYLDNGSEYGWDEMIMGFSMLSKMAGQAETDDDMRFKVFLELDGRVEERVRDCRTAIINSIPYNAKGKSGIEGAFSVIEQVFFSTIQGWTAGDRMNKKTHQKGKEPVPFEGTPEDFLKQAAQALEWYHKRPQQGRLGGKSPNETLSHFIEDGWGMTALNSPEVLALAFATTETRVVDRGRVQFTPRRSKQTLFFYHDDLLPLGGCKVTVKVPAYDPQYVFVFYEDKLVCVARPEETYHPLDGRGAEEVARRRASLNRHITEKRKSAALLSLVEDTTRHLTHLPEAPEAPVAKTINVQMIDEMRALEAQERARLVEKVTAPKPPLQAVDQWGVDDSQFIKDVVFLDDDEEEV